MVFLTALLTSSSLPHLATVSVGIKKSSVKVNPDFALGKLNSFDMQLVELGAFITFIN